MKNALDLEKLLTYTLGNAPLTSGEREQVYREIDSDNTIHESFTESQRGEERKTVLRAPAGWIALSNNGSKQLVVRWPQPFCGAQNCSILVFVREHGQLKLALTADGSLLIEKKTIHRGFHDLTTYTHESAGSGTFTVYRWNGTQYDEVDSYDVKFKL